VRAGYGSPTITAWYPHDPVYEKRLLQVYRYNPSKVKSTIKQSGISNPDFKIILSTAFPDTIAAAQLVQANLKSSGIDAQLELLDPATNTARLTAANYQATVTVGGGASRYPSSIAYNTAWRVVNNPLWGPNIPSIYTNAIAANQQALTKATQRKTLRQLQAAGLIMSTVIELCDRPTLLATSSKVHAITFTLDGFPLYGKTWVSN
jgi:ABC-type transport system substrate-binding protein